MPIIDMLNRTSTLEELYLGMNRIQVSSDQLLNALANNSTLKVFDYSFNKLGDGKLTCANAISNCFRKNKTLLHVDLSENGFNKEEATIISEGLSTNKKIYGIHFKGNYGYIDTKGFLILKDR